MIVRTIHEELMDAVSSHNLKAVLNCLESGADPNFTLYKDEDEPNSYIQPTTPLRLVMFSVSDCLLNDDDLKQFAEIAIVLLKYNANPKPAMEIVEYRYGKYDASFEENSFMNVWRIVANAK